MEGDPVYRCPGCGSLLTAATTIPGIRECGYCACFFPVELGCGNPARSRGRGRVTSS
ncbi:MAG TPA: hypothetical protein VMB35_04410 [Methanomicrobiales archaeon]|nr:hypothetical protein [Methanomicrobiales archaeon]